MTGRAPVPAIKITDALAERHRAASDSGFMPPWPVMQNALHVVELLRSQEDDETIRSWFRGMNPDLGDRSPALVVRDKPEDVIQAARAFLAQ